MVGKKNRKAWTSHACLATKRYPHKVTIPKKDKSFFYISKKNTFRH
jgi:hypothetical protein